MLMKRSSLLRKQTLRLILGFLTLILPIALPVGMLITGADPILRSSISIHYYTGVKWLYMTILILFGLTFILYGLTVVRERLVLLATGLLTLLIAFVPTYPPNAETFSWAGHIHIGCAAVFFALLGWITRNTFNLPLQFSLLSRIGIWIWVVEGLLFLYFLAFRSWWPPLVFILEAIILWLFTFGIYVRNKISKKLAGAS